MGVLAGLVGMVLMLVLFLLIGAVLLMLACKICGVTTPSFFKAVGVTIITGLAGFAVNLVLVFVLRAVGIGPLGIQFVSGLVCLVLFALLYVPLLRTSFGKGLLVCIVEGVMAGVIALIFSLFAAVAIPVLLKARMH
jgi:hypothetical protein